MNSFQDFLNEPLGPRGVAAGLSGASTGFKIGAAFSEARLQVAAFGASAGLLRRQITVANIQHTQFIRDLDLRHSFLRGTILESAGRSGFKTTSKSFTANLSRLAVETKLTKLRAEFKLKNDNLVRQYGAELKDFQQDSVEHALIGKVIGGVASGAGNFFGVLSAGGVTSFGAGGTSTGATP